MDPFDPENPDSTGANGHDPDALEPAALVTPAEDPQELDPHASSPEEPNPPTQELLSVAAPFEAPPFRPTSPASPKRWLAWIAALVVAPLGCLGVLALGGLMLIGMLTPPSFVQTADQMQANHIEKLREAEIVYPDERILMFYSEGLLSIMEGGSVLTDTRVISYQTQEDEVLAWSARFSEISDIYVELEGSFFEDTQLMVETNQGLGFLLYLSTENDGDQSFINRLRKKMKSAGPRGQQVRRMKGSASHAQLVSL